MKIEKIVKPFYDALAEGRILARKCKECGAIEYPPRYACNTCGYHETEWVELSGKGMLTTLVTPSTLNADPWNRSLGSYAYGIVELEEGVAFNATVFGIKKKNAKQIQDMLPLPVHPKIVDKDGCATCFWELDEVEGLQ
ncbi:MAG: zinc ribbon domain-containing protein [Agathobacter sp.]|uniref:Zn-ribbon domain-containing OB-fold protein n=1 Tax=Agathobacter sp. TaxID=2021311 RepID=UPI00258BB614|nr:zinc ribbon domain-containing protein [Agathobacter sp.]MCR5678157.1 zinc ribbon domain-containing protein [Agathobacter sp.]